MDKHSRLNVKIMVIVLLIAATLAIYARISLFDFISVDDSSYVYQNSQVRTGLTQDNILWSLTATNSSNWHPLTWVSHMLDCQFYGLAAGGHHLTSLLIHILNSILLFLLLVRITGSTWRSAFVAGLFALHPLNVESVAWIAERKNVLSTLFWILTIWTYIDYTGKRTRARYILVLVLFTLGLMSKPMLVTLPLVLILLDKYCLPDRDNRLHLVDKLPFVALVVASCIITLIVQSKGGMTRPLDQFSMGERLANAVVSYTAYICKMVWPANLCILYPHPGDSIPTWRVVGATAIFLSVTCLAILAGRKRKYITFGWLWYVITLIPVIGVIQVGPQAMADRYAYVPMIGIGIIMAWGIPDLFKPTPRRNAGLIVMAVTSLMLLAACTWHQVGYWRNGETVVKRAVQVTHNHLPTTACLVASLIKGDMTDQALHVLRSTPNAAETTMEVGALTARVRLYDYAEVVYREAVRMNPRSAVAHNNLGTTLARLGKTDAAIRELSKSARLNPRYAIPRSNLGYLYLQRREFKKAEKYLRAALAIDPTITSARERLRLATAATH
ncbi:MAG: tetratricopeptide repeat protein [Armatimonadota bacterium]